MSVFLNLTFNGLPVAAVLFMVSAGLSLIFGLMGVLNFAHGSFFLWGAYSWYGWYIKTGNFWLALLGAIVTGAVLGALTERLFIRTLYGRPLSQILVTLGLALVLNQLVVAVWGQTPLYPPDVTLPFVPAMLSFDGASVTSYRVFVLVVGLLVLFGVWALLRFTRVGLIVRAGVENATMVRALGINVGMVFLGIFSLGAALAAFGGALYVPYVSAASPDMGQNILLSAIIVVVLGGLGSYVGSAVGALIIGLGQEYVAYYLGQYALSHPAWQAWANAAASLVSLILLIAILLLRPQGLLGSELHVEGA